MFISSAFILNGMDRVEDFSFAVNGTVITVNSRSIEAIDGNVGVIVASFNRQLFLSGDPFRWFRVGDIRRVRDNVLKFDETKEKKMKSTIVVSVEPMSNDSEILAFCYNNVFSKVANELEELQKNRTIAIEEVGNCVGFSSRDIAPVALKTTIDFVQKNPKTYAEIYLLVKEKSDIALYRKWVDDYVAQLKK